MKQRENGSGGNYGLLGAGGAEGSTRTFPMTRGVSSSCGALTSTGGGGMTAIDPNKRALSVAR